MIDIEEVSNLLFRLERERSERFQYLGPLTYVSTLHI